MTDKVSFSEQIPSKGRLETPRLQLLAYSPKHKQDFVRLNSDPQIRRFMEGEKSPEQAERFFQEQILGQELCWAVVLKDTEKYIGHAFLCSSEEVNSLELGFLFFPENWGQGFATEVASLLARHALEMALCKQVVASVDSDHVASIRVLEKAGFELEREEKDEKGPYLVYSLRGDG